MSCYFRHLKDILDEVSIEPTPGNRKRIDQAIHRIVGVTYKDCPATWRKVKQQIIGDEEKKENFVRKLQDAIR